MKKTIKLTESDLMRIVKKIINEQPNINGLLQNKKMPSGTSSNYDENKRTVIMELQKIIDMAKRNEETAPKEICDMITKKCEEFRRMGIL